MCNNLLGRGDAGLFGLAVLLILCGCSPSAPPKKASSETKVLELLGATGVEGVTLFPKVDGSDAKLIDEAHTKVMNIGSSVAEKVKACRETPNGTPAEIDLAKPYDVANVEETFGPPGAKAKRKYSYLDAVDGGPGTPKEIDYYTYGNLEIGVDAGKVVVVVVKK